MFILETTKRKRSWAGEPNKKGRVFGVEKEIKIYNSQDPLVVYSGGGHLFVTQPALKGLIIYYRVEVWMG